MTIFFCTINITIFYHKNNGYLAYFQQDNSSFVYILPTPTHYPDSPGLSWHYKKRKVTLKSVFDFWVTLFFV